MGQGRGSNAGGPAVRSWWLCCEVIVRESACLVGGKRSTDDNLGLKERLELSKDIGVVEVL